MKPDEIRAALAATGITQHDDRVVPVNGKQVPLPYFVIHTDETDERADLCRVGITAVRWQVHLFTKNRDFALECKIRKALRLIPTVEVEHFPDGAGPYQTSFLFTTRHKERTETP